MPFDRPFHLILDRYSLVYSDRDINLPHAIDRLVSGHSSGSFPGSRLSGSQRYQWQLVIPVFDQYGMKTSSFILQVGGRFADISDFRIDFNPAAIEIYGVDYQMKVVDYVTNGQSIQFVKNGKATRIDVSLDIAGLTADDLVIWNKVNGGWVSSPISTASRVTSI